MIPAAVKLCMTALEMALERLGTKSGRAEDGEAEPDEAWRFWTAGWRDNSLGCCPAGGLMAWTGAGIDLDAGMREREELLGTLGRLARG